MKTTHSQPTLTPPANPRPLRLFAFALIITLGWAVRWFSPGFFWIPSAPDISHTIGTLLAIAIVGSATVAFLRREKLSCDSIGFTLRRRYLPAFGFGAFAGAAVVIAVSGVLTLTLDGRWSVGSASFTYAAVSLQAYFWASALEEMMFRGYLLPRLIQWWGRGWALAALALAFGLLHLPGLAGMTAVKMVCTTAVCGLLFSSLVLRTGTLWSAIAAHAAMNWTLHTVLGGTDKPGLFQPNFPSASFHGIDVGFWTLLLVTGAVAYFLLPKQPRAVATSSPQPSRRSFSNNFSGID